MILGLPLLIAGFNFGLGSIKNALLVLLGKGITNAEAVPAIHAIKLAGTIVIPCAFIDILAGVFAILTSRELQSTETQAITSGVAILLIPIIYGLLIRYGLMIPWIMKLKAAART